MADKWSGSVYRTWWSSSWSSSWGECLLRLGLATISPFDAATSSRSRGGSFRWTFGDSRDHDVQSRKNLKNVQTTITMKKLVIYVTILLVILISDGHSSVHRNKRQIVENGIRVTDLWLKFLFDWFPDYFPGQLMSTPVLFLPQVRRFSFFFSVVKMCIFSLQNLPRNPPGYFKALHSLYI
mgnify:FL=1